MNIKKIFSSLPFVGVASLVAFEILSNLFSRPALGAVVKAQGFKVLLEIKNEPFNKGKRTFVNNKADLIQEGFIPYLTKESTDGEGAYYLNRGCRESLNSNNGNDLTLGRARRYCTVNGAVEILEERNARLIEDLEPNEREQELEKVFRELKNNIFRATKIRDFDANNYNLQRNIVLLRDWCLNILDQKVTSETREEGKYARSWCVTLNTPR